MCLNIDEQKTEEYIKEEPTTHIFYKGFIVDKETSTLKTLFLNIPVTTITTKAIGELDIRDEKIGKLNLDNTDWERGNPTLRTVYSGAIHAYTSKTRCKEFSSDFNGVCLTIAVKSEHIVGMGRHLDVCFSEYTFTDESINELKNRWNIEL